MTYYVIYRGIGRDGGFGDYAGAHWDEEPLTIDGEIVWLRSAHEAFEVVEELNSRAWELFKAAGNGGSYTGEFPVEYEYRKIEVPESTPLSMIQAIEKISEQDKETWPEADY